MDRLFVYGSLQPGGPNEHILSNVEGRWEPGTVRGKLVDGGWGAELGYPGINIDANGENVDGQLFTSPALETMWSALDDLEGNEYERVIVSVKLENGDRVEAYVYALCQT